MSYWKEKAKEANQKAMEAMELISTAGRKRGTEQSETIAEAFRKYQEASMQSIEAFNEGLKEYSEEQFKSYNDFFLQMQKTMEEAFRKYREAWKV